MSGLAERLERGPLVLDGGLATELERRGHDLGDRLWSARLLRDAPGEIEAVHRAYFEAGADVAISASYQASFEGFASVGIGADEAARLLRLSVRLARRARDAVRPDGLVAASVGPYGAVLADGSEYTGDYGAVTAERLAAVHRPRIAALLAAAPDALALETIPSLSEAEALVALLGEFRGAAAWISFTCRDGERLSDGTPIERAARLAGGSGRLVALGINCTAPEHVDSLLERARAATGLPLLVYPNHGRTWDSDAHAWRGPGVDAFPPATIARWRERGASAVGGCCGIGPDAIAAVAGALRTVPVPPETRSFLAERHAAMLELALWVRAVVVGAEPDLSERVYRGWDGIGFRHPEAGYLCAIYPQADHVRLLFEHGVRLSDPDGLLEGTGAQTRHVTIRGADERIVPALGELVRDAVAERLFRR